MTRRGGYVVLAASILVACLCAGLIAWRLAGSRDESAAASGDRPANRPRSRQIGRPAKISPIIDAPGEPVLVRRGAVTAPEGAAHRRPRKGQSGCAETEGCSLLRQFHAGFDDRRLYGEVSRRPVRTRTRSLSSSQVNSDQATGAQTQAQIEAGSDDDCRRREPRRLRSRRTLDERQQQPARGQRRRAARPAATQGHDSEDAGGRKDQRSPDRQRLRRGKRADDRERGQAIVASHRYAAAAERGSRGRRSST